VSAAEKIFVYALLVGMIITLPWRLPRHWSGRTKDTDLNAMQIWGIGLGLRTAIRRAMPVIEIGFTCAVAAAAVVAMTGHVDATRLGRILIIFLMCMSFLCGIALQLSVILFNWPKFVVAPPFRGEDGLLVAFVKRRRKSGRS
jgi:hypothetical protein